MNFSHLPTEKPLNDTYLKREDKASHCKHNDYLIVLRDGKELAITYARRPTLSDYMFASSP